MESDKVEFKKLRWLKVYSKYRLSNSKCKVVPEIRLCGKWLREVGFKSGDFVEITSEMNKITIQRIVRD